MDLGVAALSRAWWRRGGWKAWCGHTTCHTSGAIAEVFVGDALAEARLHAGACAPAYVRCQGGVAYVAGAGG